MQGIRFTLAAIFIVLCQRQARGSTIEAASADYGDVAAAYVAAADGDTVTIPAGDVVWSNTLVVAKSLIFRGAGSSGGSVTKISRAGEKNKMFDIQTRGTVKMDGMWLRRQEVTNDPQYLLYVDGDARLWLYLSDMVFEYGWAIEAWGRTYGLAYNCTFRNLDMGVRLMQAQTASEAWAEPMPIGSTNTFVIEDCDVIYDSDSDGLSLQQFIYGQYATRIVFRYNTYVSTNTTADTPEFDCHGYSHSWGRGGQCYEIYKNRIVRRSNWPTSFDARGGTHLIWSNDVVYAGAPKTFIRTRNENFFNGGYGYFNPTDQLANVHFWGNTRNGIPQTEWTSGLVVQPSTNGCVFDKNEWSAAFTANTWSAGVGYVETSYQVPPSYVQNDGNLYRCLSSHTSGATTEPGTGSAWQTVWVQDAWHIYSRKPQPGDPIYEEFNGAANPDIGYTPLPYPHPLRGKRPPPLNGYQ